MRNAFLAMLAYRLRYYTGIITYLVFVAVHYFIWHAVFAGKPEGTRIQGFTLPEMITYVSIAWISRSFYFSDIDEEIDELVRTGQMSIVLLRPVNFQLMLLSQAFGGMMFRLMFFAAPIATVVFLVFPVAPPSSLASAFMFLFSTFLAFLLFAELNFLVGLLSFSLKSIQGIVRAKYYLFQLLSGLLIPLTFFPDWAGSLLRLLPFQGISYIPLTVYLGKGDPSDIALSLGLQMFWVVILFLLGRRFWDAAMTKLTLQGG